MASFAVTGSNTKVTFEYTLPTNKMQNVVGNAAEHLWNKGYGNHGTEASPILFSSLTNQQKLDLVDEFVKVVVNNIAKENYVSKALHTTTVVSTSEVATNLSL